MKLIFAYGYAALALLALPAGALAQYGPLNYPGYSYQPAPAYYSGGFGGYYPGFGQGYFGQTRGFQVTNFQSLFALLQTLLGYFQVFIFIVALLFFLIAAWKFVTGDAAGGQKTLMHAVTGLIVAVLVFSIIPLVCWVTQSSGPACNL